MNLCNFYSTPRSHMRHGRSIGNPLSKGIFHRHEQDEELRVFIDVEWPTVPLFCYRSGVEAN